MDFLFLFLLLAVAAGWGYLAFGLHYRACSKVKPFMQPINVHIGGLELTDEILYNILVTNHFSCPNLKNIYLNSDNQVCIQCKYTSTLTILENNYVVVDGIFTRDKNNMLVPIPPNTRYKETEEWKLVFLYLLRFLHPETTAELGPVIGFFEKHTKWHAKKHIMSVIFYSVSAVIIIGGLLYMYLPESNVSIVKNGNLVAYPNVTCGDAYENYLSDVEWEGFTGEDGNEYVNVSGYAYYLGEECHFIQQFEIYDDGETFELGALEIDGEPTNELIKSAFTLAVFEEANSEYFEEEQSTEDESTEDESSDVSDQATEEPSGDEDWRSEFVEPTAPLGAEDFEFMFVTENTNLRYGPGKEYDILTTIPEGSEVEILGYSTWDDNSNGTIYSPWVNVRYGKYVGWMISGTLMYEYYDGSEEYL